MKNIYYLLLLIPIMGIGQQSQSIEPLKQQLQIGLSFQGPDITYQQPLSNKFLLSLGVGGGLMNYIEKGYSDQVAVMSKKDRLFSPFTRISTRYIYNRIKRLQKGHSIINNVGNYVAYQNKLSFGGHYGTVMINEFNWGTQLPLGMDILFETHVGFGRFDNIKTHIIKYFPTIGLKFSYVIF